MPAADVTPRPLVGPPPVAVAAALLAFVGTLPVLSLALMMWTLGGLLSDGGGERMRALLPLAAGLAQVGGGVQLFHGRDWRLLAVACLPATTLFGWLVTDALAVGQLPVGLMQLLLVAPVVALGLAVTPAARRWVDLRQGARADRQPAPGARRGRRPGHPDR